MNPQQFVTWLSGYMSAADDINFGTCQQWKFIYRIKEVLNEVKDKPQLPDLTHLEGVN